MCDEMGHRDAIQVTAQIALDRISRDCDHIAALMEELSTRDLVAIDAMVTLSEASQTVHALMHRMDDDLLTWAREEHMAAVLVDEHV